MDTFFSILVGLGLAAACGFRVFVPLLIMSLASRASVGHWCLGDSFAWIGSTPALITFGAATVLEIAGYYIPWVDNLLDTIATPTAIVAGILVTASAATDVSPFLKWTLAVVAGGGTTAVFQGITADGAAGLVVHHRGLGNPVVATVEAGGSALLAVLAITLPVLAFLLVVGLLFFGVKTAAVPPPASPRPPDACRKSSDPAGAIVLDERRSLRLTLVVLAGALPCRRVRLAGPAGWTAGSTSAVRAASIPPAWWSRSRSPTRCGPGFMRRCPDAARRAEERLDRLLAALLDPARLRPRYEAGHTATARRGFADPQGQLPGLHQPVRGPGARGGGAGLLPRRGRRRAFREGGRPGGGLRARQRRLRHRGGSSEDPRFRARHHAPDYRRVQPISDLTGDRALLLEPRRRAAARRPRPDEALAWLRKAVAIDPELGGAWVNLGVALRRAGDLGEAEARLPQALEADPDAVSAYQNLAGCSCACRAARRRPTTCSALSHPARRPQPLQLSRPGRPVAVARPAGGGAALLPPGAAPATATTPSPTPLWASLALARRRHGRGREVAAQGRGHGQENERVRQLGDRRKAGRHELARLITWRTRDERHLAPLDRHRRHLHRLPGGRSRRGDSTAPRCCRRARCAAGSRSAAAPDAVRLEAALARAGGVSSAASPSACWPGGARRRGRRSAGTRRRAILRLDGPLAGAIAAGAAFELRSPEEAPVLAARLVTGTPPGAPLPEIAMRLATTRGTNALLERKGAATALFITRGFADLLRIGTQQRPDLFALEIDQARAALPRGGGGAGAAGGGRLGARSPRRSKPCSDGGRARCWPGGIESAAVALMHSLPQPAPRGGAGGLPAAGAASATSRSPRGWRR